MTYSLRLDLCIVYREISLWKKNEGTVSIEMNITFIFEMCNISLDKPFMMNAFWNDKCGKKGHGLNDTLYFLILAELFKKE